jgi:hypothetical protein
MDPSPSSQGIMDLKRVRLRRHGFKARIESNWDMVGAGEVSPIVRYRVVRAVVCSPRCSQDLIWIPSDRWRYHSLGKRQWALKLETSTALKLIDSMLLHQTSSLSGVNEERTDVRRVVPSHRRWADHIILCAAVPLVGVCQRKCSS